MQEIISQILVLLRGAWRYRWLAVVLAWVISVGGWIFVQTMPDRYESSTQVYVDTESLLRPLLTGLAVNRDVMSQVAMMQAVMLSRPNLEKVAQQTDMMLAAKTPREQEAVLDSLQSRIALSRSVSRRGGANTFQVSFQDQDPKRGPCGRAHAARYLHGRQPRPEAHRRRRCPALPRVPDRRVRAEADRRRSSASRTSSSRTSA